MKPAIPIAVYIYTFYICFGNSLLITLKLPLIIKPSKVVGSMTILKDLEFKFGYGIVLSYLKNSNEIQFTVGIPGEKGFAESMVHIKYAYRF